jgi:hypothetical protein
VLSVNGRKNKREVELGAMNKFGEPLQCSGRVIRRQIVEERGLSVLGSLCNYWTVPEVGE